MLVTPSGIIKEVNPLHSENAFSLMLVNPVKYCNSSKEVMS